MDRITALKSDRAEVIKKGLAISGLAETEKRRLTADEIAASDELKAELNAIDAEIKSSAFFGAEREAAEKERLSATTQATQSIRDVQASAVADDAPPTPFKSLGEQLTAVARSTVSKESGGAVDSRLLEINAALGANETVPSEGGFLVQTDFAPGIMKRVWETGQLFKRTDNTTVGPNSNGLKINAIDETSRATGSRWGGVRGYWLAEAATKTASKPIFRQMELTLNKLAAVFYATDELLQDTQALEQEVASSFMQELSFLVDDALIRGTGAGQPLGILNSPGTLSIAKEVGQTAATVLAENIWNMYFRMPASSIPNAEWFVNQSVLGQLQQLQFSGGVGAVPLFQPAGGISSAPYGMILGRPIVPIEQAEAVGTVGDIIFADWNAYKTISKGGVTTASSMHVAFLTDETAFRWVLRVDGQPKFNALLTPYKGTAATLSPFVTLATR